MTDLEGNLQLVGDHLGSVMLGDGEVVVGLGQLGTQLHHGDVVVA